MSATATKPKPKSTALQELEALEAEHRTALDQANVAGRQFAEKLKAAQDLQRQRQHLIHREPGLVDHDHFPLDHISDNPVAKVDEQIAELGDLEDLRRKADHTRAIADRHRQDVDAHVAGNYAAILEDLRPEAEAVAIDVRDAIEATRVSAERYIEFVNRVVGLDSATPGINKRVPGHDAIGELKRVLRNWDLPVPLPELHRD